MRACERRFGLYGRDDHPGVQNVRLLPRGKFCFSPYAALCLASACLGCPFFFFFFPELHDFGVPQGRVPEEEQHRQPVHLGQAPPGEGKLPCHAHSFAAASAAPLVVDSVVVVVVGGGMVVLMVGGGEAGDVVLSLHGGARQQRPKAVTRSMPVLGLGMLLLL